MAKGKLGREYKKPADLSMGYIIDNIAKTTDLTKAQITESLKIYFSFIEAYLKSSICPKDVKIQTPIGKLIFKEKMGLKAGSTYKTPIGFGDVKDENGKPIMETVLVEEDRPDYLRVWFEVSPTLQDDVRKVSEDRWYKEHGKNKA